MNGCCFTLSCILVYYHEAIFGCMTFIFLSLLVTLINADRSTGVQFNFLQSPPKGLTETWSILHPRHSLMSIKRYHLQGKKAGKGIDNLPLVTIVWTSSTCEKCHLFGLAFKEQELDFSIMNIGRLDERDVSNDLKILHPWRYN